MMEEQQAAQKAMMEKQQAQQQDRMKKDQQRMQDQMARDQARMDTEQAARDKEDADRQVAMEKMQGLHQALRDVFKDARKEFTLKVLDLKKDYSTQLAGITKEYNEKIALAKASYKTCLSSAAGDAAARSVCYDAAIDAKTAARDDRATKRADLADVMVDAQDGLRLTACADARGAIDAKYYATVIEIIEASADMQVPDLGQMMNRGDVWMCSDEFEDVFTAYSQNAPGGFQGKGAPPGGYNGAPGNYQPGPTPGGYNTAPGNYPPAGYAPPPGSYQPNDGTMKEYPTGTSTVAPIGGGPR